MEKYNYFKEVNPNFNMPNFDLNNRNDPDIESKNLICDLSEIFLNDKLTPSGDVLKVVKCCQTRDGNRRWYVKIQVFSEKKEYRCTFGITSDYIGASVNWALKAKVPNDVILEHLYKSRTINGHIIFPTWYSKLSERSWDIFPEGISINMAKGGESGYYDRIDYTVYAIKKWYSNQSSKLYEVIEKNKDWFGLFCDFEEYIKYFNLEGLLDDNNNIIDLTSYSERTNSYDRIIENDSSGVMLPTDRENYVKYIRGCTKFVSTRVLSQ